MKLRYIFLLLASLTCAAACTAEPEEEIGEDGHALSDRQMEQEDKRAKERDERRKEDRARHPPVDYRAPSDKIPCETSRDCPGTNYYCNWGTCLYAPPK